VKFSQRRKGNWLTGGLELVLALTIEKAMRPVVVFFGDEYLCGPVQIAVVGFVRFGKFLGGGDTMLFQHDDQHLGVDHRPGVEKFRWDNLMPSVKGENCNLGRP